MMRHNVDDCCDDGRDVTGHHLHDVTVTVQNSSFTDSYLHRIVLVKHHHLVPGIIQLDFSFRTFLLSVEFCCRIRATIRKRISKSNLCPICAYSSQLYATALE